jgi:hypothetical protein
MVQWRRCYEGMPCLDVNISAGGAHGDGVHCRLYQHVLVRCEVCQSLVKAGALLLTEATMGQVVPCTVIFD